MIQYRCNSLPKFACVQEQGSSLTFAQQQAALTAAGNSSALYTLSIVQVCSRNVALV